MKKENSVYPCAFTGGIILINVLKNIRIIDTNILNRYYLATLTLQTIAYEEYFIKVLCLRIRTFLLLLILTKVLPKKIVLVGMGVLLNVMLGVIVGTAILENGVWGVFFSFFAFFPHMFFYMGSLKIWGERTEYYGVCGKNMDYLKGIGVFMIFIMGCIVETYITPVLIENIIKY